MKCSKLMCPSVQALEYARQLSKVWTRQKSRLKRKKISSCFQWCFLLGHHNHQANPHIYRHHYCLNKFKQNGAGDRVDFLDDLRVCFSTANIILHSVKSLHINSLLYRESKNRGILTSFTRDCPIFSSLLFRWRSCFSSSFYTSSEWMELSCSNLLKSCIMMEVKWAVIWTVLQSQAIALVPKTSKSSCDFARGTHCTQNFYKKKPFYCVANQCMFPVLSLVLIVTQSRSDLDSEVAWLWVSWCICQSLDVNKLKTNSVSKSNLVHSPDFPSIT